MTFIPSVLSKTDSNNSTTASGGGSFTGTYSNATGYNSIIVNITTNTQSNILGLKILFSNDGSTVTSTQSDTVLAPNSVDNYFTKTYPVLDTFYKIEYLTSTATYTIETRLSTQTYNDNLGPKSISSFNQSTECNIDAFGKFRVSNPQTLLDLRVPGQDASGIGTTGYTGYTQNFIQMTSSATGSGPPGSTGYKTASNSRTEIYVTGPITFTNQSRKYCTYQPGKSLLIKCTGILNPNGANVLGVKSRVGYFDNYNGLYFEYSINEGCSINILNIGTVTKTLSTSWNIDPMDGTGPSGINLDYTKAQLFVFDMEWLGTGRIRFGFYAFGKIQYCHQITNINFLGTGPYTANINLPIRYQLVGNTGATSQQLIQICSTVISEGGYSPIGRPFSCSVADVNAPSGGSELFILYLRGGSTLGNYYHQQILPNNVTICSTAVNDVFIYRLYYYFPEWISTNSLTWNDVNNLSVCQYSTGPSGAFSASPSIILDSQSASGRGSSSYSSLSDVFTDLLQITSSVDNTSAVLGLSVQGSFGGSSKLYSTLSWNEVY
jgi:hypothetical protein